MSSQSNSQLSLLQQKLAYQFQDVALLQLALTHRSAGKLHNQRLEFLGDAALGLVMAELLYQRYPAAPEGELSQIRASLVNRHSLAEIARTLELGLLLVLGMGEQKSGGRQRDSILSDALEAVLGAVYLDGGISACHACIRHIFTDKLPEDCSTDGLDTKDAKTRLQEIMQAQALPLPVYEVRDITGDEHNQLFYVSCRTALSDAGHEGRGRSRREAEQMAAQQALAALDASHP